MPFMFEHSARILVVVELAGGNDGLNTVVPYRNDEYYRKRPSLAVKKERVLTLNDEIGLHPSMTGMKRLWDAGQLAIVQGCGYPNPNRDHCTSMEYWHTAVPDGVESLGWLGRFADDYWPAEQGATMVNIAHRKSLAVQARRHAAVVFYDHLADVIDKGANYRTPVSYGSETLAATLSTDLKKVAALIHGGFPTRVYYVSMGGFDTHAAQAEAQQELLMYTADALEGFLKDLKRIGRSSDVAIMVFTEFGRRVEENQSGGTDHGTATPMYVLGEKVKPGLYGSYPSLSDLDANGDLKMTVDFRSVYATMIDRWMGCHDANAILKGNFAPLEIFG